MAYTTTAQDELFKSRICVANEIGLLLFRKLHSNVILRGPRMQTVIPINVRHPVFFKQAAVSHPSSGEIRLRFILYGRLGRWRKQWHKYDQCTLSPSLPSGRVIGGPCGDIGRKRRHGERQTAFAWIYPCCRTSSRQIDVVRWKPCSGTFTRVEGKNGRKKEKESHLGLHLSISGGSELSTLIGGSFHIGFYFVGNNCAPHSMVMAQRQHPSLAPASQQQDTCGVPFCRGGSPNGGCED